MSHVDKTLEVLMSQGVGSVNDVYGMDPLAPGCGHTISCDRMQDHADTLDSLSPGLLERTETDPLPWTSVDAHELTPY